MPCVAALLQLHEAYQRFADQILDAIRKLYSSRQDKLVERACRAIDQLMKNNTTNRHISSSQVAQALQVSASHLGRTFKQATGVTFERFVMKRRVDYAKQLLLDPAYFARVFRQIAGCTPREYMQDPLRFDAHEIDVPRGFTDAAARITPLRERELAAS